MWSYNLVILTIVKSSVSGFPLGLIKNITDEDFTSNKIKLDIGDSLIAYSDALTEESHVDGSRWLDDGLTDVLNNAQKENPKSKFQYILDEFNKTVKKPLTDDLTIVSITRL